MVIQSTHDWDHASLIMSMDSLGVIGSLGSNRKTMQASQASKHALKAHNSII